MAAGADRATSGRAARIGAGAAPAGKIASAASPIDEGRHLQAAFSILDLVVNLGQTLIGREAIKQAVAAGALEIRLRAAAIRPARGMRAIPGFRRIVVAQSDAIGMADHRDTLCAARPVLAGTILARRESRAIRDSR